MSGVIVPFILVGNANLFIGVTPEGFLQAGIRSANVPNIPGGLDLGQGGLAGERNSTPSASKADPTAEI